MNDCCFNTTECVLFPGWLLSWTSGGMFQHWAVERGAGQAVGRNWRQPSRHFVWWVALEWLAAGWGPAVWHAAIWHGHAHHPSARQAGGCWRSLCARAVDVQDRFWWGKLLKCWSFMLVKISAWKFSGCWFFMRICIQLLQILTLCICTHTHAYIHTNVHACTHAHTHAHTHARTHTGTHAHTHTHTHTQASMHALTNAHACIHIDAHRNTYTLVPSCMYTHMHTHMHTCTHTHMHACMHTRMHARTHTHTHTHTHAHRQCGKATISPVETQMNWLSPVQIFYVNSPGSLDFFLSFFGLCLLLLMKKKSGIQNRTKHFKNDPGIMNSCVSSD